MRASIVGWLLLWAAVGCGSQTSSQSAADESLAASQGDETAPDQATVSETEGEPEEAARAPEPARPSGPGTVTLVALVDGTVIPAEIRVLADAGEAAATSVTSASGSPLTLPAGDYRVEVSIRDASALADRPTQTRQLRVEPGDNPQVEARFPWAKVTLNVLVGGKPQPGAKVTLLRNGEAVAEMKSGAAPVAITPGRYEADVALKGSVIRVTGLHFPEGATQTVPVRVQF